MDELNWKVLSQCFLMFGADVARCLNEYKDLIRLFTNCCYMTENTNTVTTAIRAICLDCREMFLY